MSKIMNTQKYAESMTELWNSTEKLLGEIPAVLKDAENTSFEGRKFTYARGGPGGVLPFREAADKAWIVLTQASDVLVEHFLNKVPRGSYDRRLALRELETRWPELASKHFYDRYGALQHYVRNNGNYYSTMDLEMLRYEVDRVAKYVADVKATIAK
ncbi:MAG: hypothetical protein OK455_05630 [Thaumarchaeota archaeon]|nr:hypothetical protein [Nitrososphaerota archaeon]